MENLTVSQKILLTEKHINRIKESKQIKSNVLDCFIVTTLTKDDITYLDYIKYCHSLKIDAFIISFDNTKDKVQNIISKFDNSSDSIEEWDNYYDGKFKSL